MCKISPIDKRNVPASARARPARAVITNMTREKREESLLPFSFKGRFKSLHPSFDIEMYLFALTSVTFSEHILWRSKIPKCFSFCVSKIPRLS